MKAEALAGALVSPMTPMEERNRSIDLQGDVLTPAITYIVRISLGERTHQNTKTWTCHVTPDLGKTEGRPSVSCQTRVGYTQCSSCKQGE